MAKNYIQDGNVLTLTAPAGGVTSGGLYAIGALVVVSLHDAAEGEPFAGKPNGVWSVPATAGLTAGAEVSLLGGQLVAAGTAEAVPCGKLVSPETGGYANLLLIN